MRKGSVLLHALILVALLGWLASALLNWGMGRQIQSLRTKEGAADDALLRAAQARLTACFENSGWPQAAAGCTTSFNAIVNNCMGPSLGIPAGTGTSFRFESSSFTITAQGTPPDCKLTLTVKRDSRL